MAPNNALKASGAIIVAFLIGMFIGRATVKRAPPALPPKVAKAKVPPACRVAIILDDWGYSTRNLPALFSIEEPITLSILPNLAHSEEISREAQERGKEIILHMPMEPLKEDLGQEEGTLRTDMHREEVIALLDRALASIEGERGLSNHMGSKATENRALMQVVIQELKGRNLFFVDSFVTRRSLGAIVAGENRVHTIRRDVFLDNESEPEYIKRQLARLVRIARRAGFAVGIGHDKRATVEVLKAELPRYGKEGIKFVFVSELVR